MGDEDQANIRDNGEHDDPVDAALAEYREKWFSGKRLDPDEFCQNHPECGPELRKKIEDFIFVAGGFRDKTGEGKDKFTGESDASKAPQIMGDFKILHEIGQGGMGTVYEAEQVSLRRKVALKVLPSHLSFSDEAVLKFRREAEAGGRQSHSGIVAVHAVGEHEGAHYIAQELVEGGYTLSDKLEELRVEDLPQGYFRQAASLVSDVADALEHAHESGVIHRDIKPSNILLTREGQPKVTDFGLAKVEDALALSRTGDFAGTPYYMSPEQAASRRIGIDKRTDIYSLGVTLYEMLTLKRPFEGDTSHEVLKKILLIDPVDPHRTSPRVPRDLSTICLKAMEKLPEKRYQSMEEFGEDLGRFLSGDVILAKPAGFSGRFWKRVKRNPVVSAAVGAALLAVLAFSVVLPWAIAAQKESDRVQIEKEKNEAVAARKEAEEQRRIAEKHYQEIIRLSDVKRFSDLRAEADALWPAYPEKITAHEIWITRAEELLGRLEEHKKTLAALRTKALAYEGEAKSREKEAEQRTYEFEDVETRWQHDVLAGLVSGLEALCSEEEGLMKDVKARLSFAQTVKKRSIDDFQELWDEVIASIADEITCPQYKGLVIKPIVGLVPIGQDPDSGLWEFSHLQTGEIALRDMEDKLMLDEGMGLVFVLIPGGTFKMGTYLPSKSNELGMDNVDPFSETFERPAHEVTLPPFLLSKFEMTQGQWFRFTKENPSSHAPGGSQVTLLHPVEHVSWEDCTRNLSHLKLRLPTESEWEYATRALTTTVWWTGNDSKFLEGAANLRDKYWSEHGGDSSREYEEWDDLHGIHAPVGTYIPNAFGLHDVLGNVWEWCQDSYHPNYHRAPTDGSSWEKGGSTNRVYRGGSWDGESSRCRSAYRNKTSPTDRAGSLGLRPAASLPWLVHDQSGQNQER